MVVGAGDGVEGDRDGDETGANEGDEEQDVGRAEELTADAAGKNEADVVDRVNLGVPPGVDPTCDAEGQCARGQRAGTRQRTSA